MKTKNVEEYVINYYNDKVKIYNSIFKYAIEIGVISNNSLRRDDKDITNAMLLYIHENGSPANNIPSRPVIKLTIQYAKNVLLPKTLKDINKGVFSQNWNEARCKLELERLCQRMRNEARKIIYRSNLLEKNKPATIKRKGSDRPLLDTGKLAKSITCRLIEI